VGGTGGELIFLSAINPTINGFSFRATDTGGSIVDPTSAKLFIDGESVPLTVSPKNLDATDFSYTRATPFAPGSDHTYAIEVKDTTGKTVADASTFKTIYYAVFTGAMQSTSADTSKRGFLRTGVGRAVAGRGGHARDGQLRRADQHRRRPSQRRQGGRELPVRDRHGDQLESVRR
jgi:hypothetical protein